MYVAYYLPIVYYMYLLVTSLLCITCMWPVISLLNVCCLLPSHCLLHVFTCYLPIVYYMYLLVTFPLFITCIYLLPVFTCYLCCLLHVFTCYLCCLLPVCCFRWQLRTLFGCWQVACHLAHHDQNDFWQMKEATFLCIWRVRGHLFPNFD